MIQIHSSALVIHWFSVLVWKLSDYHVFMYNYRDGHVIEVTCAPGVNRQQSAHKTVTHISVDLVIVLFRVDLTCHTSRITVTRHNVCSI